jgi:hypothetical protein
VERTDRLFRSGTKTPAQNVILTQALLPRSPRLTRSQPAQLTRSQPARIVRTNRCIHHPPGRDANTGSVLAKDTCRSGPLFEERWPPFARCCCSKRSSARRPGSSGLIRSRSAGSTLRPPDLRSVRGALTSAFALEECEVVWGSTARHVPWISRQGGNPTVHANSRANHPAAMDANRRLQEIAAHDLGGSPEDYDLGNERMFRKGASSRGLTFAQAAARDRPWRQVRRPRAFQGYQRHDEGHGDGVGRRRPSRPTCCSRRSRPGDASLAA